MKALENRTLESKREMDILDALDEIRTRNARIERINADVAFEKLDSAVSRSRQDEIERIEREDEELARTYFKTSEGEKVKRLDEKEEDYNLTLTKKYGKELLTYTFCTKPSKSNVNIKANSIVRPLIRKRKNDQLSSYLVRKKTVANPVKTGLSLINTYGPDSDSSD